MIFDAALRVNPAFNIYRIFDTVSTSLVLTIVPTSPYYIAIVSHFVGCPRVPVSLRLQQNQLFGPENAWFVTVSV